MADPKPRLPVAAILLTLTTSYIIIKHSLSYINLLCSLLLFQMVLVPSSTRQSYLLHRHQLVDTHQSSYCRASWIPDLESIEQDVLCQNQIHLPGVSGHQIVSSLDQLEHCLLNNLVYLWRGS